MKNIILLVAVVLTGSSLLAQTSLESAGLTDNLLSYFSFDKAVENSLTGDLGSAKSNTGTLNGATITSEAKFSGNAINFNGTGYVEFVGAESGPFCLNGENKVSVALWVKAANVNKTVQRLVSVTRSYHLEIGEDNNLATYTALQRPDESFTNAHARAAHNTLRKSDAEQWKHVAFTFDGTKQVIYINGVEVTARDADHNDAVLVPFKNTLYLGASMEGEKHGDKFFTGSIDELYIYNRSLTGEEVTLLMNMENPQ